MTTTSLVDLTELLNCNYADITKALTSRNIGLLVGSLAGGIATDMMPTKIDILLGAELLLFGVSHMVIPWCPNIPVMGVAFLLEGAAQGALSTGWYTRIFYH